MHESPVWLIKKGRIHEAESSLVFYNRSPAEVAEEVKLIKESLTKQMTIDELPFKERSVNNLKLFLRPNFYRPYLYLQTIFVLIEWSSFPVLAFYLITIFKVRFSLFLFTNVISSLNIPRVI